MTSRITVNNIESNSGISSIALDSGVTIETGSGLNVSSGIVTASTVSVGGSITASNKFYGDASQLTSIPGANITGTIPQAALTNVDLTSIRKDISILSLQTAVDTNRVAYNLANSFVDQFESDIGIGASTNATRDTAGEYVSSVTLSGVQQYVTDSNTLALMHCNGTDGATSGAGFEDSSGNDRDWTRASAANSMPQITTTAGDFKFTSAMNWASGTANNGNSVRWPDADWQHFFQEAADWTIEFWHVSHTQTMDYEQGELFGKATSNTSDSTGGFHFQARKDTGNASQNYFRMNVYHVNGSNTSADWSIGSNTTTQFPLNTLTHCALVRDGATVRMYVNGVQKATHNIGAGNPIFTGTANRLAGDIWCGRRAYSTTYGRFEGSMDEYRISNVARYKDGTTFTPNTQLTTSATASMISKANTASSARTKVSGVLLYKNESGTATLGTDLKVSFTCNGGTNWTALSSGSDYTLASDFSTGVKTVYLAEKTCTSGTDVRYKIEWANQASGSKVTQVHGMAINY